MICRSPASNNRTPTDQSTNHLPTTTKENGTLAMSTSPSVQAMGRTNMHPTTTARYTAGSAWVLQLSRGADTALRAPPRDRSNRLLGGSFLRTADQFPDNCALRVRVCQ